MLKVIVEEKDHWASKNHSPLSFYSSYAPNGIDQIRTILSKPNQPIVSPSTNRLAEIYAAISERPESCGRRESSTQIVYGCILALYNAEDPLNTLDEVFFKLEGVKRDALLSTTQP